MPPRNNEYLILIAYVRRWRRWWWLLLLLLSAACGTMASVCCWFYTIRPKSSHEFSSINRVYLIGQQPVNNCNRFEGCLALCTNGRPARMCNNIKWMDMRRQFPLLFVNINRQKLYLLQSSKCICSRASNQSSWSKAIQIALCHHHRHQQHDFIAPM